MLLMSLRYMWTSDPVRWGSWSSCWPGRRGSWTDASTTARRSEAARWRTCVRISSATGTTTRAKTLSPQESLGNEELIFHPIKHNSNTCHITFIVYLFTLSLWKHKANLRQKIIISNILDYFGKSILLVSSSKLEYRTWKKYLFQSYMKHFCIKI